MEVERWMAADPFHRSQSSVLLCDDLLLHIPFRPRRLICLMGFDSLDQIDQQASLPPAMSHSFRMTGMPNGCK